MLGSALAKLRSFLVRSLAVAAVVATYAVGSAAVQIANILGVSSVVLATTATPAQAHRRRFRRVRVFFAPRRRFVRRRFFVPRRRFVRARFFVPRRRFVRARFFVPRRRFVRRGWWGG
jgi:hypothetical protein